MNQSGLVLTLALSLGAGMQTAMAGSPVAKGDRVVFLGDSITQAGAGPNGYVSMVRQQLDEKLGAGSVEVIGAGISGNRVPDLEKRLERDVLSKDPTVVVIYIGINDVWHSTKGRGTPKDEFEAGLRRIIEQIQKQNARVYLCTPSVIGEKYDQSNSLDSMLEEYAAISRQVAKDTGSTLIDLREAFLTHLKANNAENKEKNVLTSDGVHLNAAGNSFVAQQMVAALTAGKSSTDEQSDESAKAEKKGKMLRHVVLFKFKDTVSEAQVQEVVDAFAALPAKIDAIIAFEHGTDVGVEGKSHGFTHGFIVTFRDTAGRDEYLPHPAHKEFGMLVRPRLEDVLVFDYWTD